MATLVRNEKTTSLSRRLRQYEKAVVILGYPPSLISLGSRAQPDFKGYFSISATDFVAALTL
jgi:hypothetical protein